MNQSSDLREMFLETDVVAQLLGCNEALKLYYSRYEKFDRKTFIETIYEIEDNNAFEILKRVKKEYEL